MNLEDFISTTLVQIMNGIENAATELKDSNCVISPRNINHINMVSNKGYGFLEKEQKHSRKVDLIDYDVAISIVEGKGRKGGLRVGFGSLGLGGEGTSESSNSTESRIRFSIPIVLPNPETAESEDGN